MGLFGRFVILACCLALPPACSSQDEARPSLAGQLLVASPSMSPNSFSQTVVLLLRHDREGAFGVVINRPLPKAVGDQVVDQLESEIRRAGLTVRLGGPVEPQALFLLHSSEIGGQLTEGRFAVSNPKSVASRLGTDSGPKRAMLVLGYAGWAADQLEAEMARGDWLTADADPELVFGNDDDGKWSTAVTHRSIDL